MSTRARVADYANTVLLLCCFSFSLNANELPAFSVNGHYYDSLQVAFDALQDGDTLRIAKGVHNQAGILRQNNVTIIADKGAHLSKATVQGKAALVIKGNNTTIKGLECSGIRVAHKNGACIRFEGDSILLENVYFHDSQQGILSGSGKGLFIIENSRFERLGYDTGQSHGIYIGAGELYIKNSVFLASKEEGHEIKSRADKTHIENTIISSAGSVDSRLVDVPNGGVLVIRNSVLHQGPESSNRDLISFGVEGVKRKTNSIEIVDNLILMERGVNQLVNIRNVDVDPVIQRNVIVGRGLVDWSDGNITYNDRDEIGLKPYPYLPEIPK